MKDPETSAVYHAALELVRLGVSVIPIQPGTKEPPLGFRWGEFTTRVADASELYDWFEVKQWALAVVCGPISGNLVVIDFDQSGHADGGYATYARAHPAIRELPRVKTGKGRVHVYCRSTTRTDKYTVGGPGEKIEVRSGNHYCVAPPSMHPQTGKPYIWSAVRSLDDGIPRIDLTAIGFEARQRPVAAAGEPGTEGDALAESEIDRIVAFTAPFWVEGQRYNLALALAGWMAGYSVPEVDADTVILHLAADEPEKGQRNALRAVRDTYKRWRQGYAVAGWSALTDTAAPLISRAAAAQLEWLLKGRQASITFNVSRTDTQAPSGVTLHDFRSYLPEHKYIFIPSRALWPRSSVTAKLGKLAAPWLDQHQSVEQMTWAPGAPHLIEGRLISDGGWIEREGLTCFNLYQPPIVSHGDAAAVGRWLEHVNLIYPTDAEHIIAWLAHRVQRPGEKINHALVLGGQQGIGKDTLLDPVRHAVGPWNVADISPVQLLGRFNSFVKSIILRVSEARDLGDINRYSFYEHLKTYTAAPPDVLRCDEKNVREYSVMNVCGVVITTNHKTDGIYLPADDRRHFVAWSELTAADFDRGYWSALYDWFRAGGYAAVAAYLAQLDIANFDPKAPPPQTESFWEIVDATRAPEDAEMADALDALYGPDAVTIEAISYKASSDFAEWMRDRRNRRQIPHRLEAVGYIAVRNDAAKDGRWKVAGKNQVIYAKRELSATERLAAARQYAEGSR
jgi:hypothetical protein